LRFVARGRIQADLGERRLVGQVAWEDVSAAFGVTQRKLQKLGRRGRRRGAPHDAAVLREQDGSRKSV